MHTVSLEAKRLVQINARLIAQILAQENGPLVHRIDGASGHYKHWWGYYQMNGISIAGTRSRTIPQIIWS
jgi:hypothetical protein